MVFEKALVKPVCNWNITADKFIFQEDIKKSIYVVSLKDENLPKVYKFKLPIEKIRGQKNTRYDIKSKSFKIPKEQHPDDSLDWNES